ncbi:acyltransferase [Aureimonas leprariae]|uniref:Acyltransferase n=1 Tax=Plantimonas leprariae TaxID=2615207 RepID=A0A7V7PRL3_9HYPH|nr:acyltransferase [Aureimonas leprariae]KAB0681360.1 acyltransferase [Aureimonas leprariae]
MRDGQGDPSGIHRDLPREADSLENREDRLNILTWERVAADWEAPAHRARTARLARISDAAIAPTAYVARDAFVLADHLVLGERSWIAGHAIVRGDVEFGTDCSVNPYACISGKVRFGDGVRIASHASVVGFNHSIARTDVPIHAQPVETRGIAVGDDVWIGANAVVLDGVAVGRGAVIAAGAVVTRNVPDRAVVAGSPARVIKERGTPLETLEASPARRAGSSAEGLLRRFGRDAASQWPEVIGRERDDAMDYLSRGATGEKRPALRHLCDAIEIAAGFGGFPEGIDRAATVARLRAAQDPVSGLFPDPYRPRPVRGQERSDDIALYNVLAIGYALEVLDTAPSHPVSAVSGLAPDALCTWLEALPWRDRGWHCGAVVDAIGTALAFDGRYHGLGNRSRETLFGWLALHVDPASGLWSPPGDDGWLQPVNGYYRLVRGSYAQFGLCPPRPDAAIDTVLGHWRLSDGFRQAGWNACNVLDVIYPLWYGLRWTAHRRDEVVRLAAEVIERAAACWEPGRGFAFGAGQQPGLQGTEMWLATLHYAARLIDAEAALPFVPRGVHRTDGAIAG